MNTREELESLSFRRWSTQPTNVKLSIIHLSSYTTTKTTNPIINQLSNIKPYALLNSLPRFHIITFIMYVFCWCQGITLVAHIIEPDSLCAPTPSPNPAPLPQPIDLEIHWQAHITGSTPKSHDQKADLEKLRTESTHLTPKFSLRTDFHP